MKSKLPQHLIQSIHFCYSPNILSFKSIWKYLFVTILLFLVFNPTYILSQPSGGPYGPIRLKYELPKVTGKTYFVAPDGKTEVSGESIATPTTLEVAVNKIKSGDAVILRGGIYRTGDLVFNQSITLQPYADEEPVLKGTYIAKDWIKLEDGLWVTSWSRLFPSKPDDWWQRDRFGKETPLYRFNNDMVFINGRFLQSVGWEGEVNEDTYYINYESGKIFIGTDPANKLVEITAFNVALHRIIGEYNGMASDRKGPVIRGITFTQYAYRAIEIDGTEPVGLSDESKHGKEVVGTTLENCTFSFFSRVAAYLRGDKLTMRNCIVSGTSTEGIYVIGSSDVLLEKNIFTQNNIEKITGYFPAAVKIFNQCYRVTCRDNLITDLPFSNGIWYDVGNVDGCFINNWVENVGNIERGITDNRLWPSNNGFFFEISKGAICAGNVFVNCDQGIFILNSSNVQIVQNTMINSPICIGRNERSPAVDHTFGWHSGTGPDVDKRDGHLMINNLFVGEKNYRRTLMNVWQPDSLCNRLDKQQFRQFNHNVFARSQNQDNTPLFSWSPAANVQCQKTYESPEELKKLYPEFSHNTLYTKNENEPLFKSVLLKNYRLLQLFPGSKEGVKLSPEIIKLLGYSKLDNWFVGAYPAIP
jgi:parallel beta-helix repeat protein